MFRVAATKHLLVAPYRMGADVALARHTLARASFSASTTQSAYIHPLSQIVLEHLQNSRSEWTQAQGLDKTLQINKDGTFDLTFPDNQGGKLFTSYEASTSKHWLTVQRGHLSGRYLLQDNKKSAWQDDSSKTSLPDRIRAAIDDMIDKIDTAESSG